MKNKWHILYYETEDGRCPIRDFIDTCKEREQAKLFSWFSLLESEGPNLPRPYADFLADGIHELRIKLSRGQVRLLYFFCYRDFIVFTHPFIKRVKRVSQKQIDMAKSYREDFLSRFDEKKLREVLDE
jgi:phage-related protein